MKTLYLIGGLLLGTLFGYSQAPDNNEPIQSAAVNNEETIPDTTQLQSAKVDTVVIEKVRVDTVFVPVKTQNEEQTQAKKPNESKPKEKKKNTKVYYGGNANFVFGKYSLIGFEPIIGYKLLPKFSVGAKLSYAYFKNDYYSPTKEGSNYGVAAFSRLRIKKRLYVHVEYSEMNYKLYDASSSSYREWVSFLYLGGGLSQRITKNTSINAQVLWDVLQNDNSPYKAGEPIIFVGIGVGF